MSCHWDIYCFDCKEDMGERLNHGEERLTELLVLAPRFATTPGVAQLLLDAGLEARTGWGSDGIDIAFLEKHGMHRLVLKNEYGGFVGSCNTWIKCVECRSTYLCKRPKDHAPPHASEPYNDDVSPLERPPT